MWLNNWKSYVFTNKRKVVAEYIKRETKRYRNDQFWRPEYAKDNVTLATTTTHPKLSQKNEF